VRPAPTGRRWRRLALGALLACAGLGACAESADDLASGPVRPAPEGAPWQTLVEWRLFVDTADQVPNDRVVPYEMISPLFTDYAAKHRFIWVPEGEVLGWRDVGPLAFPVGSILVKTFAYPVDARAPALGERLVETRLLVHESGGWKAHTYVYAAGDPDPTKATLKRGGTVVPVSWIDADGAPRSFGYVVPNENECAECHGEAPSTQPLGPRARQLDRDSDYDGVIVNQIDYLASAIGFDQPPPAEADRDRMVDPFGDADVATRARAWLDVNCAHCHSAAGDVSQKALWFDWESTAPEVARPVDLGVCKVPTSSGGANCERTYDIVPGEPDASVLLCRVESTVATVQMPPLGRTQAHVEAAALLREWIAAMEPVGCD
jgi:uncharacterized repeat protein (TIGR03806 family)